jgi:hypothetical protein
VPAPAEVRDNEAAEERTDSVATCDCVPGVEMLELYGERVRMADGHIDSRFSAAFMEEVEVLYHVFSFEFSHRSCILRTKPRRRNAESPHVLACLDRTHLEPTFTTAALTASDELPAKAAMILLHNKLPNDLAIAPHVQHAHSNPLANTKIGRLPKSTFNQQPTLAGTKLGATHTIRQRHPEEVEHSKHQDWPEQ